MAFGRSPPPEGITVAPALHRPSRMGRFCKLLELASPHAVIGVVLGGLLSVIWFELLCPLAPLLLSIACRRIWRELRAGAPFPRTAITATCALAVMVGAVRLPLKHQDQPIGMHVPPPGIGLRTLVLQLHGHRDPWTVEDFPDVVVPLPEWPTWRELDRALRPIGYRLRFGYCGNGATLLWGGTPIGGPTMERIDEAHVEEVMWELQASKPTPISKRSVALHPPTGFGTHRSKLRDDPCPDNHRRARFAEDYACLPICTRDEDCHPFGQVCACGQRVQCSRGAIYPIGGDALADVCVPREGGATGQRTGAATGTDEK